MDEDHELVSTWADDIWVEHGFHPYHGDIRLIGDIDETSVNRVSTALFLCRTGVRFLINSEGGSVIDGKAVFDMIRLYKQKKECLVVGSASSMAAAIVQAFDRRVISQSAHIMIHDGTVQDDEKHARDFEQMALQSKRDRHWYYAVLAKRCGRTPQYWGKLCTRDAYFTAKEALRAGLVDEII